MKTFSMILAALLTFSPLPALSASPQIAESGFGIQLVDHAPWHDGHNGGSWNGNNGSSWNNNQKDWQKNKKWVDCHRSPERHVVKGYGRVLHRHVGPNCRVQLLKQSKKRLNNNCIRLGDFWLCT